jgi:hypothetical protein
MKRIIILFFLLAGFFLNAEEGFYLLDKKTNKKYGPFVFKNQADLKLNGRDFSLIIPDKKEYKKISTFGMITTVYISKTGFKDKNYIAQVINKLKSKSSHEIWFFDEESETPANVPMTDTQLYHWKAKYSFDANTGNATFQLIQAIKDSGSPPKIKFKDIPIEKLYE